MDVEYILANLPEDPREGMVEDALSEHRDDELGGNLLIYERRSWYPGIDEDGVGWPDFEPEIEPRWAGYCTCTACQDDFWTGWATGGGLSVICREDGLCYPGVPDDGDDAANNIVPFAEGEQIDCPYCGAELTLTRRRNLRNGRTFQIMVGSIENIGPYTAMLSWLVSRRFDEYGLTDISVNPCFASVIDEDGRLQTFCHAKHAMAGRVCASDSWRYLHSNPDPFQARYYSWEAFNHNKVGGWMWEDVPEQLGQTGEKTGLADYIKDHGNFVVLYLRFWWNHRSIENLVKAGWTYTLECFIEDELSRVQANKGKLLVPGDLGDAAGWDFVKPTDMLYMTKEEVRQGRKWRWDERALMLWWSFVNYGYAWRGDAAALNDYISIYGLAGLENFSCYLADGWDWCFRDFDRYLAKQERRFELMRSTGLQLLFDYREMLADVIDHPTDIELWPVDLRAAHDRMTELQRAKNAEKTIAGFGKILEKWGALEWSDGTICARLPRTNQDLVDEGHTLNHCVSSYGEAHVEGRLIIFIRHARRPERSWFTLNIDTTGKRWREIQLHGYGNEHAHGKKLKIPKEVRDFCDRWEKEVLAPVFRQVKAAEQPEQEKPKKKRRRAA